MHQAGRSTAWTRGLWLAALSTAALAGCGEDPPITPAIDPAFDTVLDTAPAASTNAGTADVTFHAVGDAGLATFTCRLDDAEPMACTSPFTATVGEGAHLVVVTAYDHAGRPDPTPPVATWIVDQTAPDVSIDGAPPALSAGGAATFVFRSTDPTVRFECSLDGADFTPCASPFLVDVADGDHTLTVRAVDAAGNVSEAPGTFGWTFDGRQPDTVITAAPSGLVGAAAQDFEFSATGDVADGATFECAVDDGAFAPCTSPVAHADGSGFHVFLVRAVSAAGAADPSPATQIWQVDADGPAFTLTEAPTAVTEDRDPSFAFTTDEPADVSCAIDDAAQLAPCAGALQAATLAAGAHVLFLHGVDALGNVTDGTFAWTQGPARCGDGYLDAGEFCDGTGACNAHCAGVFTTAATMVKPRHWQSATRLLDGTVLLAGGFGGNLAQPELYDPGTNTFVATGTMPHRRYEHTANLLADGRVVITGGFAAPAMADVEIYDPIARTFTDIGPLTTPRYEHTGTLLPSGKLLLAGGRDASNTYLASAELYDPSTGTSVPTGAMHTPRALATETLLPDGTVLVAGGLTTGDGTTASAELYDPATETWTAVGDLATARQLATATLTGDGLVIAGGFGPDGNAVASVERYAAATTSFVPAGDLVVARGYHTATLLDDGTVLFTGGFGDDYLASAELYDPSAQTSTLTSPMAASRYVHTATLLEDGSVLVCGGFNGGNPPAAELFHP